MKVIKGNLIRLALQGEAKYIVHGCNCFHAMDSGIAGALASRFHEIPLADKRHSKKGAVSKLASYSKTYVTTEYTRKEFNEMESREDFYREDRLEHPFICINLYTQYKPGADFIPSLFPEALKELNNNFKGKHLWFPMIGCGIGGGDWAEVQRMMLDTLKDVEVTVVVL